MISRNNPTSNTRLAQSVGKISTIKPSEKDLRDLEILCNHCSTFGKAEGAVIHKVIMRHDTRNELYACPQCPRVVSEKQVRYVMRLELPEFVNYEKKLSKEIIDKVNKDRQNNEKFIIKAVNSDSPTDLLKRSGAKVVSSKNNNNSSNVSKLDELFGRK